MQNSSETNIITRNYALIRERIEQACARVGRPPSEISVVGVAKTRPAEAIREAVDAGIVDIGENYVQELLDKQEKIGDQVRWHYIGHLQRNKVRTIAPFVHLIHGVDSERLAAEINRQAEAIGRTIPLLIQINTSGEESKYGIPPEEAIELATAILPLSHTSLQGLMTIAAPLDDPEEVRPMFQQLRTLRDEVSARLSSPLPHLSMGMTDDFEVAVEEGATMIRIGTALFGQRSYPAAE